MLIKEQREQQLTLLFYNIDMKLLNHSLKYNDENVKVKCLKCNKEHKIDMYFMHKKIELGQACSCSKNNQPSYLESYKLKNFYDAAKEIEELQKEEKIKIDNFLVNEHKEFCEIIKKSRGGLMYKYQNEHHLFECKHNHLFKKTIKDLISGKWCDECEKNSIKYYD